MAKTVLILGASGRFGRHAAAAFAAAGWQVRPFRRGGDLVESAGGADVIVNAWNPPYPDWAAQVPGLTARVIEAARVSGARVVIPGNVYVYGAGAPERLATDTPHAAQNPLGRVRVELEAAYRDAGVPTLILRAGDFLDTAASGNWFDRVIVALIGRGLVRYPGALDAIHAWAYLPDLARAAVALAEREAALARFEDVGFPGYAITGRELAAGLEAATGRKLRLRRMSWLPLKLLRPVWPMARALVEMSYLWSMPHRIDGARFDELLPGFQATPLEAALRLAVAHQVDPDQPVPRRTVSDEVV